MKALYLVTGVSSGIGHAFLNILLDRSETVIGFSRNPMSLPNKSYANCTWDMQYSLHDQDFNLVNVIESRIQADGCTQIALINNAGSLGQIGNGITGSLDSLRRTMNVNFLGPAELTKAVISYCTLHGISLSVLNVSTGAALKAIYGWSEYCASKSAFDMWTRCLQMEVSNHVKVSLFYPAVVDTAMQEKIRSSSSNEMPDVGKFIDMKKNGLLLKPEVVAQVMVDLLADPTFGTKAAYDVRDYLSEK